MLYILGNLHCIEAGDDYLAATLSFLLVSTFDDNAGGMYADFCLPLAAHYSLLTTHTV